MSARLRQGGVITHAFSGVASAKGDALHNLVPLYTHFIFARHSLGR